MNLFGYIRVSGKGQVMQDGPERQREAIIGFCSRNGVNLMGEFFDKGVSGAIEGMARPQFVAMIEAAIRLRTEADAFPVGVARDAIRIDGIVVEKLDRLARDLMVQEAAVLRLKKHGLKLFLADRGTLVDEAETSDDPGRTMFRQMCGIIAEFDKANIVARLNHARAKIRNGGNKCEGAKRYGEKAGESQIMRMIMDLRIERCLSYGQIALRLNEKNLKTRFGRVWTLNNVAQVINNYRAKKKIRSIKEICEAATTNT